MDKMDTEPNSQEGKTGNLEGGGLGGGRGKGVGVMPGVGLMARVVDLGSY